MFRNCQEIQTTWEAFLDGDLNPQETDGIEIHLEDCVECQFAYQKRRDEMTLIGHQFRRQVSSVTEQIDFDNFYARIAAQIEDEAVAPKLAPAPTVEAPSFFAQLRQWFQSHPGIPFAFASAVAVIVIFALPFLDPGPDPNDCVVENVTSNKTAQVAVLQTKNQHTGQRMTVIVVNEPPADKTDVDDDDDDNTPKIDRPRKPKHGKKP